ncbi:oxidoreductase, aldo/keto reductase family protein [Oesophagostomum dentatum]|uniref:Oxidoreductase, aldo/keto reductase family protein n=1 Tax=Oesophagostomum dentatum TaxID=61180 RepID=A0A0B1T026_OESDE|nr:oxidoreductase, aldo/keto reductase family protein [Oesophagostomum dentatum]
MEKLYDAGKLKAIGLSNFDVAQLQNVYDHARIKPANLQVMCNVYWPQLELHKLCKNLNISFTAYSPLGSPGNRRWGRDRNGQEMGPLNDPVVEQFAEKYRKTPAQILLRYLIQRGMTAIPKTVRLQRLKENMDIFDFTLSDNEMETLNSLRRRARSYG